MDTGLFSFFLFSVVNDEKKNSCVEGPGLVFNGGWINRRDMHVMSLSLDILTSHALKFHPQPL